MIVKKHSKENQMKKADIPKIAKDVLDGILDEPGSILYSSHETLKPGSVYLLGLNPGGAGGSTIEESLNTMLANTHNAYLDESWENRNGTYDKGEAPLQKRVQYILKNLGLNTENVCASNLIFIRSRDATSLNFSLAKQCWPVHEAILSIVQPKLIIAFGNSNESPYQYLHEILKGKEEFLPSGHGNWKIKGFESQINGHPVYVVGLPHLSRYSPIGKDHLIEWLQKKFRS
jgi:hypothetical protein